MTKYTAIEYTYENNMLTAEPKEFNDLYEIIKRRLLDMVDFPCI